MRYIKFTEVSQCKRITKSRAEKQSWILLTKKKNCNLLDFDVPVDHRIKESEKVKKFIELAREMKKQTVDYAGYDDINCS